MARGSNIPSTHSTNYHTSENWSIHCSDDLADLAKYSKRDVLSFVPDEVDTFAKIIPVQNVIQ